MPSPWLEINLMVVILVTAACLTVWHYCLMSRLYLTPIVGCTVLALTLWAGVRLTDHHYSDTSQCWTVSYVVKQTIYKLPSGNYLTVPVRSMPIIEKDNIRLVTRRQNSTLPKGLTIVRNEEYFWTRR